MKDDAVHNCRYRAIAMTVACHKCMHYYVTWDQYFPHGCRAMKFKSKRIPINEVRMAMRGKDCLAFEMKKQESHDQDQGIGYRR